MRLSTIFPLLLIVAMVACVQAMTLPVFVTSQAYDGNRGGLAGADAICQSLADASPLVHLRGRAWMAWLSDTTGSPFTRFVRSANAYTLPDNTTIASDWADLTSGTLANAINVDERGNLFNSVANTYCSGRNPPSPVSTNTLFNGTFDINAPPPCNDWSDNSASMGYEGFDGRTEATNGQWSEGCASFTLCSHRSHLFCFSQN